MPKGEQRSNKMTKKPKKDTGPVKESVIVTNRPAPPVTIPLKFSSCTLSLLRLRAGPRARVFFCALHNWPPM